MRNIFTFLSKHAQNEPVTKCLVNAFSLSADFIMLGRGIANG